MSKYPLDIEAVHTDDERIYMSKGHHDPHQFMRALREDYGDRCTVLCTPTHHWVKRTPAPKGSGYTCLFHFVEPGCRGAFPATYARECGADVYAAPGQEASHAE